ncbi:MAG: chemotaxis protein CheW [Gammaproteobacteria bacterium]|nr:chemotaxis protein CheW [Gammaproteobacteria bacterium]
MKIGQEQQILVEVGALEFCIDLNEVLSIINPPKMVRLPAARGAFTRAFKYQDELGAAVSMRAKFELDERQDMQSGQLLLGRINDRLAGFWFDKVVGILKLGDDIQVYEDIDHLSLPSPEIDQLFIYKQRLIPHISLSGLLRFEQPAELKQWLKIDKPELERLLQEAAQARVDALNKQKNEEELAKRKAFDDAPPAAMALEEFYALMDEAGVGIGLGEEAVFESEQVVESELSTSENMVVASVPEAVAGPESLPEPEAGVEIEPVDGLAADRNNSPVEEPAAVPDNEVPLAIPVSAEPDATVIQHLLQTQIQATEESEAKSTQNQPQDDAMFALEKKGAAYRQRMDAEQELDLTEYQIIKVGDHGLIRRLRRWLRRLILSFFLLGLVVAGMAGVEYVELHGNPVERVIIQTASGDVDWGKTYTAGTHELKRYAAYVVDYVQRRRNP